MGLALEGGNIEICYLSPFCRSTTPCGQTNAWQHETAVTPVVAYPLEFLVYAWFTVWRSGPQVEGYIKSRSIEIKETNDINSVAWQSPHSHLSRFDMGFHLPCKPSQMRGQGLKTRAP